MTDHVTGTGFHRTRIAPTPSGFLHLGNVFSFAITITLARSVGAAVLLRVDDLDAARVNPLFIADIFDTLTFLNIPWQEGPRTPEDLRMHFSQSHRLAAYHAALHELREREQLFACACSRAALAREGHSEGYPGTCLHKQIPLDQPGVCWRLRTDRRPVTMQTLAGVISFAFPQSQDYFIVRRKDGLPAYQLSSVVDDLHFGVDLIVRGEDLLFSTLAQLRLAEILGRRPFLQTTFYHHPLLLDADGRKLSKSAGDTSVQWLRRHGRRAADIYTAIGALPVIPGMTE